MKLVHTHESLAWFPAIRALIVTSPSDQELHGGSSMMVATMSSKDDKSGLLWLHPAHYNEFLLVCMFKFFFIKKTQK